MPGLRSLAPGPGGSPTRLGAHGGASHDPATHHEAAAPIRRGRPRGGKGPHAPCVRFCALLRRRCDSRPGRGLRRATGPEQYRASDRRRASDAPQKAHERLVSLRSLAVDDDVLLDVGPQEAAMAAETYCGQVTSPTQVVDSRRPQAEQVGDLLLGEDVRLFQRAVAPRRAHRRPHWLARCTRRDREPPVGSALASARY